MCQALAEAAPEQEEEKEEDLLEAVQDEDFDKKFVQTDYLLDEERADAIDLSQSAPDKMITSDFDPA